MPKRTPLYQILKNHFLAHPSEYVKNVDLFVLASEHGFSPVTADRETRRMELNGEIKKSFYNGRFAKNLVQYSLLEVKKPENKWQEVVNSNGERVMQLI